MRRCIFRSGSTIPLNRLDHVRSLIGAVLLFMLILCSCQSRSEKRQVVVYTSVDQIYSEPILKKFGSATGIEVLPVYDTEATKTVGLVNRLVAEKDRPRGDVFWNGEFVQTHHLKKEGVLAPYSSTARDNIPEKYRDEEGFWTAFGGRARVLLVNTHLVSREKRPRSLHDLLDPSRDARKIGIATPLFGTTATHAAALYALKGKEQGRKFFEEVLARKIRVLDGNAMVRDLVVSGELHFGLTDSDDALGALRRGAPVEMILPDQNSMGTLVIPCTAALVKGSPHPREAGELLDYLFSDEVEQELLRTGFCQIPVHSVAAGLDSMVLKDVREMKVSYDDIVTQLPRTRTELKKLFIR